MSKAKPESVAEIIARRKANATKKETEKKPAPKKAGVIVGKKKKKATPINSNKKTPDKKANKDIENLRNPDLYLMFVEWMATPDRFREVLTQKEFAKEIGVGEDTLSEWKKRPGFWDSVREERRSVIKDKMVNNVISALYRTAIRDGQAKEAKLLLELGGEYEEKRVTENTHTIKELSEERQKEISKRLDNWFSPEDDEEDDEVKE